MVGDRLNTDIEFGLAGGLATLLVLTGKLIALFDFRMETRVMTDRSFASGITKESEIWGPSPSKTVPKFVIGSLGDLRAVFS